MAFWSNASPGVKDPKRQFRWVAYINSIPTYVLKKVTKPSFNVTESAHKFLNHTYYYPGRVEWQEVSMTLADPVDPDMASTVVAIVNAAGYQPAQTELDLGTMSKSRAVNALGNELLIAQLDSEGRSVEEWRLTNPWVKDVKFGDLDYEGDDLTDIELTIRYDWASITAFSPGAPSPTAPSNAPGVPYWALGGNPVE